MPWTYAVFEDLDNPDAVFTNMRDKLRSIPGPYQPSAKVEASAMGGNLRSRRGLVVWNFDDPPLDQVALSAVGTEWSMYTWYTDHDYTYLYTQVVGALYIGGTPDFRKFSQASAWNARICMTNEKSGDATLTLYWR